MDEGKELGTASVQETKPKEILTLPFRYELTTDSERASYREWRVSPVVFEGEQNKPRTDEEIVESVRKQHEAKEWYTQEYWRGKGLPSEQLEFTINGRQITLYNFNSEVPFTDEYITRTQRVLNQFATRFPETLDELRWVLIDDIQPSSLLGDEELYPTNGTAMREYRAFRFMPKGIKLSPHRVEAASNYEGTLVHELGHLIQGKFEKEWREKFKWNYCFDHDEDWEVRETRSGERKWFNKQTGEMSPQGQFPLQPDQCVTAYARQNMGEDICESLVAYIYDPELLKRVSPDKFEILRIHNSQEKPPTTSVRRIPQEEIALPKIKPETVYYFIQE